MDTADSLVIKWLEQLTRKVYEWKRSGSIKDKEGIVDKLTSIINEMKYSYLEPDELMQVYFSKLLEAVKKLKDLNLNEKQKIFVDYLIEEAEDLPRKLRLNPSEPYQVFRYRFVDVVSVSKHPSLNLLITVTRDGEGIERTVVTNDLSLKQGEKALIVLLPPKEFNGVWSKGMFVQFGVKKPEEIDIEKLKQLNSYFYLK